MRGYFEIGIYRTKCDANVGTLWRSSFQLGASGIFTIGKRFPIRPVINNKNVSAYPHA